VPSVAFENWWSEFQRAPDALAKPHAAARRIGRYLRSLDPTVQLDFIDDLLQALLQRQHRYGVSLFMLEQITDPKALSILADRLDPLPDLQSEDEEGHLADLIRILATVDDSQVLPVVRTYLVERAIGPHWSSVPWAVWPHHKELFGQAWARFYRHQPPSIAEGTLVIRSFLSEPDAIHVVRKALVESSPRRWDDLRGALLRQAGSVRWMDDGQRAALDRSLE
jgi:hypothetical protein